MTDTHKAFGLLKNLNLHLNNIVLLKDDRLPTRKPPSSFLAKTRNQLTQWIFLSPISAPKKNELLKSPNILEPY